jgi:hypothetical protein
MLITSQHIRRFPSRRHTWQGEVKVTLGTGVLALVWRIELCLIGEAGATERRPIIRQTL